MRNVLQFLEQSAVRHPDKMAVIDIERSYTYSQLLARARAIGAYLAKQVKPKQAVVVFAEKSADVLAAFFGTVYAGAFYVPIDPGLPAQRIRSLFDILDPQVVFALPDNKEKLAEAGYHGVIADLRGEYVEESDALEVIREKCKDMDPLYGIFTSGSTGVPKCVLVSHRGVIDFISSFVDECDIRAEDVLGNQAPFDFDVSVKDIYSTIFVGATLVLIPKSYFMFPNNVVDWLDENRVTTLIWAVSSLCLLVRLHGLKYKVPSCIRKIMFSGEVMPIKQLNEWRIQYPEATFINLYGPTEITCNCTYHILNREYSGQEKIPMGKPFRNETVFLLDEGKEVTEPGVIGEVCVSGSTLAIGYYKDPVMTAKNFVQNPLNKEYPETIYRTGDLAYIGEDGLFYFAGRKDNQIKHMGHRIELEELESVINGVNGVERVCCFLDERKNKMIAIYMGEADKAAIVDEMRNKVPEFMIPNRFVKVDDMPITKNGKLNRKELIERYGKNANTLR